MRADGPVALVMCRAAKRCGEWSGGVGDPDFLTRAKAGDHSALGRLLNQFHDLLRARATESFDQRLRGRIGESDLV